MIQQEKNNHGGTSLRELPSLAQDKKQGKDQRKRVKKYYQANHLEAVNSDEVLGLLISVSGPKPHPLTETLIHIHGLLRTPFQVRKLRLAESPTVLHHFWGAALLRGDPHPHTCPQHRSG